MTAAPLDAAAIIAASQQPPDVEAIAANAGLPMGCSHPDEDYRPAMAALVHEVERLAADLTAAQQKVARVEALAQRSAMLRVQISAHQITDALAGEGE